MTDNRLEPMDRAAAAETVRKLGEDDLRFLNRLIVDRLKLIHQARSTVMLANFNVGDRVRFPTGAGEEKTGVIIRLNKKTASIATDDGHRWNVHPGFLRIDEVEEKAACGTGILPVNGMGNHGQDGRATGILPVNGMGNHGQDGRATGILPVSVTDCHGQDGCATGILPVSVTDCHGQDGRATGILPVSVTDCHGQDGRATGILPVSVTDCHGQDGRGTIRIRQGAYLPHWTRCGGFYVVVFRLHDSLPARVLAEWKSERDRIVHKKTLSVSDEKLLHQLFSERVEKHLDAGHGNCWMSKPEIADIVANAICFFDKDRYRLLAWCVMPNHVHVVIRPNPGHQLEHILHSWKSFTANKANKLLHHSGSFWQPEYYDHLIRDEADLFHAIEYTMNNPLSAGLRNWRWLGCAPDLLVLLDDECGTGILPVKAEDRHANNDANPAIRLNREGLGYGL